MEGEQRTAALLLDFEDTSLPCDADLVRGLLFDASDSIDDFFREASGHRVTTSGDVFGPFLVPFRSDECVRLADVVDIEVAVRTTIDQYLDYETSARRVAAENGVDLSDFDRVVFVVPDRVVGCLSPSAGVPAGVLGDELNQGRVWVIGDATETPFWAGSTKGISSTQVPAPIPTWWRPSPLGGRFPG